MISDIGSARRSGGGLVTGDIVPNETPTHPCSAGIPQGWRDTRGFSHVPTSQPQVPA